MSFHSLIEISRGVGVVRKKFHSVGVVQINTGTPWHCGDSEESDTSMLVRLGPDLGTALGNCSTMCRMCRMCRHFNLLLIACSSPQQFISQ